MYPYLFEDEKLKTNVPLKSGKYMLKYFNHVCLAFKEAGISIR